MKTTTEMEKRIRELVPELMELSFGCEITFSKWKYPGLILMETSAGNWSIKIFSKVSTTIKPREISEIIGHPIELRHLLLALKNIDKLNTGRDGDFDPEGYTNGELIMMTFDLAKTVRQNLDENEGLRELISNLIF